MIFESVNKTMEEQFILWQLDYVMEAVRIIVDEKTQTMAGTGTRLGYHVGIKW